MINGIDGVDHVNIYSAGKTHLGRMLSNFYVEDIETEDGIFPSVETYFHWLGIKDDLIEEKKIIRGLTKNKAKKYGKEIKTKYGLKEVPRFNDKIKDAILLKGMKHLDMFIPKYDNLPFEHYYNFYGRIIETKSSNFILITSANELREIAKMNR